MAGLNNLLNTEGNLNPLQRTKRKQRLLVFLVFLGLSSILWFFTALKEEYHGKISYPVRYINFPKDKILVKDLPGKLTINVKTNGYTLFRYKMGPKLKPIIFDIQSYALRQLYDDASSFYILTSLAKDKIAEQLGKDFLLLDISPDTLYLTFTDIEVKKVLIMPIAEVECQKPFKVYGDITVEPDCIVITGPGSILDTLDYVKTKKQSFIDVDQSLEKIVQLSTIKSVTFSKKKVNLVVPIQEYTENSFEIPLIKVNVPDTLKLLLFPEKVKVTYMVALNDYEKVGESSFTVMVDYHDIVDGESNRIRVQLERYPDFVQNVNFQPTSVEFLKELR